MATALLALVAVLGGTAAQAWQPEKPIESIAPSGPGGGWDRTARAAAKAISDEKLVPQPIVVNNVVGGSGAVGDGSGSGGAPWPARRRGRPVGPRRLCAHQRPRSFQ